MNRVARTVLDFLLLRTRLGLWPTKVKSGVAAGARWTLYPWTSYWRGTHEPAVQTVIAGLGNGDIRGWSCWDLGAHFGLYSVGLARRVGPAGQVAAFEPNPASFLRLERHRRMNHLHWLKPYAAAVSDHNQGAELFTYGDLGTTTTHLPYQGEVRTADVGALVVRTLRLDDLVQSGDLRSPRFVKIDVEGHGHRALAGMQATLSSTRPLVMVGFHSPEEIEGMMAMLRPLNYSWREIATGLEQPDVQSGRDYLFLP
jgi:FkbM family methyltransferase